MVDVRVRFPYAPLQPQALAAFKHVEEVRGILAGANPVIGLITPSDTGPGSLGRASARMDLIGNQRMQHQAENPEAKGQARKGAAHRRTYRVGGLDGSRLIQNPGYSDW